MLNKLLPCFFMAVSLASPASARLNIATTLPWIGSIAGDIGGDKVTVTSFIKPGQDPHFAEAKPSMILAVRKADILMYNGMDLEIGYLPILVESSKNPKIQPGNPGDFECSRFIEPIEVPSAVDRSLGDVHPQGNPHYQLSPKNILLVAEGMAGLLSKVDPENEKYYLGNLAAFRERLEKKRKEWESLPLKGKTFVAYHKFFEYLALEFGFSIIGYVEPKPGIPPSAGQMEKLVEMIRKTRPDAILTLSYYGQREVSFLAQKTGVKSIVVPHDVGETDKVTDWFSLMDEVLKALR
ncbi:MAG: metal ABC transporter substrate-binding protein [Candidatus Aminicenantales bacterium]